MPSIVVLEGVHKRYRTGGAEVAALAGVTLQLQPAEAVALVGPSGCGKSTTLNIISGVDTPDEGEVWVCGVDVRRANEQQLTLLRRRQVGIVFQAFHLVPHLTLEENVALPLALDGRRDAARVRALLERVGLTHRRRHFPSELSGGEQQRGAVARALVHRPQVVVADEPTGNLDSASGAAVMALLNELRREEGAALVLATHAPALTAMADRVLVMRDGRLTAGETR